MKEKKACWYGSKQLWIMIYTAILFLIGSCVIGGNNNTVFPAFAEARGWNLDIINMVSGIGCKLLVFLFLQVLFVSWVKRN